MSAKTVWEDYIDGKILVVFNGYGYGKAILHTTMLYHKELRTKGLEWKEIWKMTDGLAQSLIQESFPY